MSRDLRGSSWEWAWGLIFLPRVTAWLAHFRLLAVCVCVCTCGYVSVRVCIHTARHMYVCVYTYTHTRIHMHVCIHTYLHIEMHAHKYIHMPIIRNRLDRGEEYSDDSVAMSQRKCAMRREIVRSTREVMQESRTWT